ncbi:prolyl-tRNA synthetase [Candidatus Nomurabacteria bacterium RIFCSPHIGHO2_02_FULL_38_15]|uniref:Prolyl-tRNA synthetase n=1 Tax=Candidatus Nomurabacteria bacterium RIFCSPHIGHO2_02_FULL_38_15 TaxID=1801752 RepID=A0A1F6VQ70_9BACT|nr:MAG: prolyl-tRNA synthetase [Candidatus Nomurabacteria bacterium RIFCSPHIGHO2_02_FULL_38_15]
MRQSTLFTKTRKNAPADETSKNAEYLIRAGYIYKEMSGVYTILPLGLKVVQKISNIIRNEMNAVGGVEMQSTTLQSKEVWDKTRWSDDVVENWFKTKLKNDTEIGLAFTHEEPMTAMMKNFIHSYKDLPVYPYDVRTIFRNEMRAKSGIMRGREFFWKALYSFSKNKVEHDEFYEKITQAYKNIFNHVGLGDKTYFTFASGGTFSKYSHEFQTVCNAGEDLIYLNEEKCIAVNKEVYNDEVLKDLDLNKSDLKEVNAVEVGNIFSLGYKFSEPLELNYKNAEGVEEFVFMGSYGIGITRLMGTIVEVLADGKGIVWPESVAPFKVHLVLLGEDVEVKNKAEDLYNNLIAKNVEVLFDDRVGLSAGEKFADADLLGMPWRLVVSKRSLEAGGFEIKARNDEAGRIVTENELMSLIS